MPRDYRLMCMIRPTGGQSFLRETREGGGEVDGDHRETAYCMQSCVLAPLLFNILRAAL